jgi:NAD-dependent dihydropyrimidine dehydrogenase PreA subunit
MEDATKRFFKMHGNQGIEHFIHGYIYGLYIEEYIYRTGNALNLVDKKPDGYRPVPPELDEILDVLVGKVVREGASAETSTYHGKVVSTDEAQALVSVKEDVELRGLEHIIPYKIANDIVLENPDHIGVLSCPCRRTSNNPCLPLDVCIAVGEPFVGLLEQFQTSGFRRIDSDEAAKIIRQEHERGHVHAAFFKDAMDGRFYHICNCCSCCCVGMKAHNAYRVPILASSGYTAAVDMDECNGCGNCEEVCPFKAVTVGDDQVAVVDTQLCMGCGACEPRCEMEAIKLKVDPSKPGPLDINTLIKEARQ